VSTATAIALAKVRATAIREAARAVSADDELHQPIHVGQACLGCRWREALLDHAFTVEHEADEP